ncbi:hypothetical protein SAMN04489724_1210 [Algoriphagus locisalis]|uniref:Outer membrane protein beta-barrel domain-containing protein n=1 Tax=Algoriphagus locisalis TaxID=305507 RepID=A0A1I6YTG0_9BACT|nr:hypothetical protein [Algoriphagus locisalis]SFT53756.1 hypothetical protein SAMN04489724_1210 [Algoriphagus locisalis]
MKRLIFGLLFMVSIQFVQAQETEAKLATQSIYMELGGPGLPYSFNYDFRFDKTRMDSWGMRVGFGGYAVDGDSFFSLPVMVNKLYGKGNHFFEMGFGATFLAFKTSYYNYQSCYYDGNGNYVCNTYSDSGTSFILDIDSSPSIMGVMNFGYRRMPTDGGFMWKVNLNPIFNNNGFWPLFAGIGLGYAF